MGTKLTSGNHFSFPKEHGFSGSCGGTPVTGYMRGGHVRQKTAAPLKAPPKSGPKMTNRPSDKEHKDYDDRNDTSDRADYPEVGTVAKPEGYAKGGMHINPAHKGKFTARHESVKQGLHSKSPLVRKEANFARMANRHFKPLAKGGEMREELHEPKGTPSEPYEAAARGGSIAKRAKGGAMKAPRQETQHDGHSKREEVRQHDHHGKAKRRDGHSTPHPFAYGGRMPGPVMGAKHRARAGGMNPMVGGAAPGVMRAPMAAAPPGMGALSGGMPGMKRGGRR